MVWLKQNILRTMTLEFVLPFNHETPPTVFGCDGLEGCNNKASASTYTTQRFFVLLVPNWSNLNMVRTDAWYCLHQTTTISSES